METSVAERFTAFVEDVGARVRQALITAYGPEVGAEATAEAFAYAWQTLGAGGDDGKPCRLPVSGRPE